MRPVAGCPLPSTSNSRPRKVAKNKLSKRLIRVLPEMAFRGCAVALAGFAFMGFNPQTLAATYTWVGTTDGNWADENWSLGGTVTAAVPGSGDTSIFNNSGNGMTSINLGSGVTVQNILFDTANAAAYTIGTGGVGNQSLVLNDAGSITVTYPVSQNETINAAVTLGTDGSAQSYLFSNNSSLATLTFAGNIAAGTGGATGVALLDVTGAGNTAISGVVSNGGATSIGIVKSGPGTLTLAGANTYTGTTTVSNGTLDLNFNATGAPANNIVAAGSALSLAGGTLEVNGNATAANNQTFAGTTFTAGNSTIEAINNGTSPTVNLGALGTPNYGTVNFQTTGAATITTTTLGGGPFGILWNNFATYGLSDWATTDTTGGTAGTGTATIRALSAVTGGYSTNSNGNGGGVNWDITTNQTLGGNTGGATTRFNTPTATTINVNGKWYITNALLVTPNMGANNAQIIGAGQWYATYVTNGVATEWVTQNNTSGFLINSTELYNDRGGTGALTYVQAGPGTVEQNVANGYTGASYLNEGFDLISADSGLGAPATGATVNLNGGTVVGGATFALDNNGSNLRPVVVGSAGGGIAATAGKTLTIDGQIGGSASGGPLTIGIPASSANGNVAGLLPGTGTGTANVTGTYGTGTVLLNNSTGNYFYGGVNIVGGATLNINSEYQLGGANYGGTTFNNGALQYNSNLLNAVTDITQNSAVTPVAQSVTFSGNATIDTNGHNISYANTIGNGGSGSLTVASTNPGGSLTFNSASTFTGAVTVNSGAALTVGASNAWTGATTLNGKLTLNSGASLANTAIGVNSGGTLQANTGNAGIGTGTGANLTLNGGSTLSLEDGAIGTLALNGGLTISGVGAASIDFDLNGSTSDLLNIAGAVTGSGTARIFINNLGGTAPTNGQEFTLINAGSGLGTSLFTLGTSSLTFGTQAYTLTLSNSTGTSEILTANFASLNYYWTGATSSWSSLNNFATDHTGATPQSSPLGGSSNVFLTADTAANYSQTLGGSYTINSLSFTGTNSGVTTGAATNSITLSSGGAGTNVLTINGANTFTDAAGNSYSNIGLVDQAGSAAHTISANIALGNSQAWEIDSANPLLVSGTIADGSTADSLTKTGNGTLVLSASNTYDGGTTVAAGKLMLGATNALLSTSTVTLKGTGTLDLAGYDQSLGSISDGGVATGTITASSGTSHLYLNGNTSSTFSGAISGGINIIQNGTGTLTLSGVNSFTGSTIINAGSLVVAGNAALGNSASPNGGLLLNPASGVMSVSFTSPSPSIAALSSTGAGTVNIVLGNALAGTSTTLTITGAAAGAGTTFSGTIGDMSGSNTTALGNLALTGGSLTLTGADTFTGSMLVNGGNLIIGNALALQDATLNLQSGTATLGSTVTALTLAGLTGSQNFALTNTAATPAGVALTFTGVNVSDVYTGNLSGAGPVTLNGSGTIQIGSGANGGASYGGTTTINSGNLIIGGTGVSTTSVTLSGNAPASFTVQDSAVINNGNTFYQITDNGGYASPVTVTIGGNASVTTGGYSFGNGQGRVGSPNVLTVQNNGSLLNNGIFDFMDTDGGTTTVGGVTVNLNGGTLGAQNFVLVNYGAAGTSAATLNLNGGTLEALASDGANSSTQFFPALTRLTANVQTGGAIINTNGFNVTVAQALVHGGGTPDGGLTKTGAGTLTLTGNNTYTGATNINGGDLIVGSANAISTGNIVFGGGTLQYTSANTTDWSPRFAGSTVGPISIDTNGQNITFATGIASSNTGGFSLVDSAGTGSLTLTAPAGYTGPTTISSGAKLILASTASLANTAITNNGTLVLEGGGTIGGGSASLTLNSGSVLSMLNGPGTLTLDGGLTVGGTSSATVDFELNSTLSDTINVSGALAFGAGGGVINLTALGSVAPAAGQQYTLITDNNGITSPNFTLASTQFYIGGQNFTASLSNTGDAEVLTLSALAGNLNYYFQGTSTPTGTWSTLANFTTDHTGATPQTTAINSQSNIFLTADSASNYQTETLDGTYTINSLTFTGTNSFVGNTPPASNSINLGAGTGGPLTIAATSGFTDANSLSHPAGVGVLVQPGSAAQNISANINLGNGQSWEIDNSPSNPLTVSGVIADGSTHDALTKTGAGTLILTNSETYDGGTYVTAGTLGLGSGGNLVTTGTLTVEGTGKFDLGGQSQTLNGLSDGGVATGTITDSAAAASTLTLNNTAINTFSGTITDNGANNSSGALSLTLNGPGNVTLSGSNSFNGLATVNGGTLVVSNNYGLGNSASANGGLALTSGTVEFTSASPNVSGLNTGASTGAGTSIILGNATAGTSTTLTVGNGGALISGGLSMQYAGTISDLSATNAGAVGNLTVAGGSFLLLGGANTFTGITTMTGNLSEIQLANSLALQDSTLNDNGAGTIFSFGALGSATIAGLTGSQPLTLASANSSPVTLTIGNNNVSSTYTGNLGGPGSLIKTGAGTVQIGNGGAGGISYAGTTFLNQGTLIIGGTSNSTASFNLTGSGGANVLTIQDSAVINSSEEFFIQSEGGNNYPGSSTVTLTANGSVTVPSLSFGDASRVTSDSLTIQGNASLIDDGFFDFDYNLGGSTNGTPTTHLNGGLLAVQKFQMTAAPSGIANPAIHFNGGVLEALASDPVGGAFLPAISGLTADVDGGGLNVNTNGFNITIAQALIHGTGTPDGGLSVTDTMATPGSLTLTGTDNYTGATTINTGATLQLGNGTAGNDGTIQSSGSIVDNGALVYNRFGNLTSAVSISGTGNVVKIGAGQETLSASNHYTGKTMVNSGTLEVSGSLSGTASVSVNNATLSLAASNALYQGAPITLSTGVLQVFAAENEALGNLTLGAGASNLTLGGSSDTITFADSSANTWSGTLTINDWSGLSVGGGTDEIFIGSSADLSPAQLADITFLNGTVNGQAFGTAEAIQLSDGELVAAVPEPGTWEMLLGGLCVLVVCRRGLRRAGRINGSAGFI